MANCCSIDFWSLMSIFMLISDHWSLHYMYVDFWSLDTGDGSGPPVGLDLSEFPSLKSGTSTSTPPMQSNAMAGRTAYGKPNPPEINVESWIFAVTSPMLHIPACSFLRNNIFLLIARIHQVTSFFKSFNKTT